MGAYRALLDGVRLSASRAVEREQEIASLLALGPDAETIAALRDLLMLGPDADMLAALRDLVASGMTASQVRLMAHVFANGGVRG